MGLLDDAIREHLDLKRQRGADPQEVERAEREALGPVRRGPEDVGTENGDPELEHDGDADYGEDPEPEWSEDWEQEPELSTAAPGVNAGSVPEPPLTETPLEAPTGADPRQPPAPAPEPHERESEPLDHGEETAEYDVEGALGKEAGEQTGKKGDDVLEETPEFLQDTPDHDRLWFEQRPPRDFDFDG